MYKFSFTIKDDDYFEFNKHTFLNNSIGKRQINLLRILTPLMSAVLILCFLLLEVDILLVIIESIPLITFSILAVFFAEPIYLRILRKNLIRMKKDGKLLSSTEFELLFEHDYFTETTPQNETKAKYSGIERIVEAEKAVYLYISSVEAYIIPLNAFTDDTERKNFIRFIEDKIA